MVALDNIYTQIDKWRRRQKLVDAKPPRVPWIKRDGVLIFSSYVSIHEISLEMIG